jgi:uncharacterized membrane protein YbhN (UPF0104 family)
MTARRGRGRVISWLVGVALIALAVWAATRAGASITSVWATITAAPKRELVLLLLLIAATPITTSLMFWVLQRRYTRLGLGENTVLIVSAWLLNFLPLAPGLVGRLAYLKAVHGTPIGHSARAIIWANVLSVVAALGMLALVALCAAAFPASPLVLAGVVFAPSLLLGALAWYAKIKRPQPDPEVWRVVAALAIRYAELHLWAARYWALFEVMNTPIAWGGALALSGVAGLAMLFPLAPNGLGLREWAVGLVAPLLPTSLVYAVGLSASVGLSADLVHRGCEVLLAVPMGMVATMWVGARLRGARPARTPPV